MQYIPLMLYEWGLTLAMIKSSCDWSMKLNIGPQNFQTKKKRQMIHDRILLHGHLIYYKL